MIIKDHSFYACFCPSFLISSGFHLLFLLLLFNSDLCEFVLCPYRIPWFMFYEFFLHFNSPEVYCWKILRLTDWLLKVYNLLASINWAVLTFRLAWCLLSDFNCEVDDHFFNGYMLKKAGFYLYSATTLLIIFIFSRVHLILDCLLIFGGDMPCQVLLGRLHVVLTLDCFKILLQKYGWNQITWQHFQKDSSHF